MQKRGCTDVICLLIFLAYVGGMVRVYEIFEFASKLVFIFLGGGVCYGCGSLWRSL